MSTDRVGQQLNCTFCQKSKGDAKALISSPDKLTYICEECTFDPRSLKFVSNKSATQMPNNYFPPSGVFGFLRGGWTGQLSNELNCSFCGQKVSSDDLYQSESESRARALICRDCLDVCRQLLGTSTA